MTKALSIKWLYGICAVFIALTIVCLAFDFLYILALPVVLAIAWFFVFKPKAILYLVAFATPLSVHLIEERISTINLAIPTEPLIIMLLLFGLLKLLQVKTLKLPEFQTILSILILVDLGWLFFTSATSTMPVISFKYFLSKSWYIGVFYFMTSRFFQKEKTIKTVIWLLALSTAILVTYTLYNHSLGSFTRTYAYTAMRPFMPDHGMYAAAVALITPPLFVFAVYGKTLGFNPLVRAIAGGLCLYFLGAIALSFTRAAWVSIAAAAGIYGALRVGLRFRYVLLGAVLLVSAVLVNMDDLLTDLSRNKNESDDNIENHLQSVSNVSTDPSNLERLNRWSCVQRMAEDKPILGHGPGTYTFNYGVYQLPHQMTIISTNSGSLGGVHSEYLRPLAESGWIGAFLFLCIVLTCFYLGFKQYYTFTGAPRYLSLAVFLGLVTYFAHAVLNNYSEFDKIAVPLYSFLAVLSALEIKHKNDSKVSKK